MNMSGKIPLPIDHKSHEQLAKESIWASVAALRQVGLKNEAALARLATLSGISRRKIAKMAYNEPCKIWPHEIQLLNSGRLKTMRWLAEYHRLLAEHWNSIANYHDSVVLGQQNVKGILPWGRVHEIAPKIIKT